LSAVERQQKIGSKQRGHVVVQTSRRNFILGSSSTVALFVSGSAQADLKQLAGKMQSSIGAMFAGIDLPFIDITRMVGSTWQAFLSPTEDPYRFLNAQGYPNAMPPGAFQYRVLLDGLLQDPSDGFHGNWVLDWSGGPATLDAVFSGANVKQSTVSSSIKRSSGRIVFKVVSSTLAPLSPISAQVNITAVSGQITNVRLFPARHEALLNSGEQWDPDFLAFYRIWGRVRFMDWSQINSNTQVLWPHRTMPSQFSQRGFNLNTQFYCGPCIQPEKNDYITANAIPASPTVSTWTHGQMVQAFVSTPPLEVVIQKVILGTTTTIKATGHPFVNGDKIQFTNSTGGGGGVLSTSNQLASFSPVFSVSGATANTFNLDGVNSSTWNGTSGGSCYHAIRFKAGLLPFKLVSGGDGNTLFSGVIQKNNPVQLIYDVDFDRLMYSAAPNGSGNALANGVSIETLVDLANRLGPLVEPWFCIPHGADEEYVTNWASYIRDNLNPQIRFCVELSNEIWNGAPGFIQTANYTNKGAKKWSVTPSLESCYQYYGFRFRQVMSNIETVFSGQMSRVNRCFGMQANNLTTFATVIRRATCPMGGFSTGDYPINHADSLAIANYYNMSIDPVDTTSVWNVVHSGNADLFAAGLNYFDVRFRTDKSEASLLYYAGVSAPPFRNTSGQWLAWARFCRNYTSNFSGYHIQLTAYEGGFNGFSSSHALIGPNPINGHTIGAADFVAAMFAYWGSSKYASFLTDATNGFLASGANFPSQYCVVNGGWSAGNPFSLKQPNRLGADTPAFLAWRALNGK
jgi:hypothetical protein